MIDVTENDKYFGHQVLRNTLIPSWIESHGHLTHVSLHHDCTDAQCWLVESWPADEVRSWIAPRWTTSTSARHVHGDENVASPRARSFEHYQCWAWTWWAPYTVTACSTDWISDGALRTTRFQNLHNRHTHFSGKALESTTFSPALTVALTLQFDRAAWRFWHLNRRSRTHQVYQLMNADAMRSASNHDNHLIYLNSLYTHRAAPSSARCTFSYCDTSAGHWRTVKHISIASSNLLGFWTF